MGLGNCCCDNGESCGGLGYPTTIDRYHGRSATRAADYFRLDYFKQRKADQEIEGTRYGFTNYIYDIDANSKFIAMACGSRGVRFSRRQLGMAGSGGDLSNSSYTFGRQGSFREQNRLDSGDLDGGGSGPFKNFKTIFKGAQTGSGDFFAGNSGGDRYGFEVKRFAGVYGVCITDNYLIAACGTDGVWLLDLNSASTAGIVGQYSGGVQLISGRSDLIINNVKVHSGILYVGTCGYSKPKYSYSSSILQQKYQPEYNSDNKFFSGKNLSAGGVYLYDFNKLLSGEDNSYLKNISTSGRHVNAIAASKNKVYIATGTRYDPSASLYGGGRLIKLEKNSTTGSITSSTIYTSATGSILDVDADGDDVYCIDSNYGVIKNGSAWINVISGGNLTSELQFGLTPCLDPFVGCFYSPGGPFAPSVRYDGLYSAKIINLNDPEQGRDILQTCPPYNQNYKTRETIGVFPSSLKVTKYSICVGLYQGGIATYDKTSGSLVTHNASLISLPDCGFFRTRASSPNEYDANYEYTLSIGKMACMGNFLYAIDSVQYVANGAGPGVYSPIERTEKVMTKSTLIKRYENFSGILEFRMT